MSYVQRGLDSDQEQNYRNLIRDTRTLGQRICDFFKNPEAVSLILLVLTAVCFFLPGLTDFILLFGVGTFLFIISQKATLPFRLPMRAKTLDYNNPKPGTNKPGKAAGIYFFGNTRKDNAELWFTNEDMRTHVLMFGSTGSGKTESLVSIAYNALLQSSGFIYVDGKGDNSLFSKIFSMARYMGRTDDLLLINFMTGARDIIGPQKSRLSNTMNPFAIGSSSMLSNLVVSMMDSGSENSNGDMWKGRAIAFVEALMKVLVAMRDAEYILLDANVIRNYFHLDRLEAMVLDKVFIRDGQEPVSLENFPALVTEPITNYVLNLPGYNKDKKGKQVSQVLEQHGFITMQLTRIFTSLADTYGHILRTRLAEVDVKDVVLNRRILVVLLPALEKSPDELANLGKVIISSLKAMMAAGLGEEVEGLYKDIITTKPTNSKTPFLCILDEYGYYAVKGFAVVPAQARSLGFSVIFAGQDLPALQKASKEEAATIGANTNIKICMKLEDPLETWDFFQKTGGESYVSQVESYQTDARSITNQYLDGRSARMEKRNRVDLLDLKEQREGEAHIFFKSKIIRAKMFYANPAPVKEIKLNQFVKVAAPSDTAIRDLTKKFQEFGAYINKGEFFKDIVLTDGEDMGTITELINKNPDLTPVEKGITALKTYQEQEVIPEFTVNLGDDLASDELNIFCELRYNRALEGLIGPRTQNIESFAKPILAQDNTLSQIDLIERLDGKSKRQASNISKELVKDLAKATYYPPEMHDKPTGHDLATTIKGLIPHIVLKKKEQKDKSKPPKK